MQNDYQLIIGALLKHTEYRRSTGEVVYGNTRYMWSQLVGCVNGAASGLEGLRVKEGRKVAVVDVDTNRYLEACFAASMMGAFLQTVNIRLPTDPIAYTTAHDLLMCHDSVLDDAVIGAKDEKWGERPTPIICFKQGKTASGDELRAHLAKHVREGKIARFWPTERIVISDEALPKTSTGKLDKKPLRQKYS